MIFMIDDKEAIVYLCIAAMSIAFMFSVVAMVWLRTWREVRLFDTQADMKFSNAQLEIERRRLAQQQYGTVIMEDNDEVEEGDCF